MAPPARAGVSDKTQIITMLRDEFNRWEELLASLSEGQITAPQLDDNWSIKDMIAHLRAWQQRTIARTQAALLDREPEFPKWPEGLDPEEDTQKINEWVYANNRERSWSSVHQKWRDGFARLLELAQAIPEKDLMQPGRYSWLDKWSLAVFLEASYDHHHEHADYLKPVLAQLGQHGKLK